MIILWLTMAAAFYLAFYILRYRSKHSVKDAAMFALISGVLPAFFVGNMLWAVTYHTVMDDVPLSWTIVEGPNNKFLDEGRRGEYSTQAYTYYFNSDGGVKSSWKATDESTLNISNSDRAYVVTSCPSGETVPAWLRPFWENKPDYEFDHNCSDATFDFYLPDGDN